MGCAFIVTLKSVCYKFVIYGLNSVQIVNMIFFYYDSYLNSAYWLLYFGI